MVRTVDYAQTALDFLSQSREEFLAGDVRQGSEKLWGAATQAVIHAARRHDLEYGSHRALKNAVRWLAEEYDAPQSMSDFAVAEKFHANFYHGFMEDWEIEPDSRLVRAFVERVLRYGGTP